MQVGGGHAGRVGDLLDFGLRAPIAADVGDGAAHDVVVRRRGRKRRDHMQTAAIGRGFKGHGHDLI